MCVRTRAIWTHLGVSGHARTLVTAFCICAQLCTIICTIQLAFVHIWNTDDYQHIFTWWRHQMETFSALLAICAGNSSVAGEFPAQRPVMRSFDVFFDLRTNKRLSKQWRGWWFETTWCPLWRHWTTRIPTTLKFKILQGSVGSYRLFRITPSNQQGW